MKAVSETELLPGGNELTKQSGQIPKDSMFYRFAFYGFLKNLKFFDPFIVLFFREVGLSFLQIGVLFAIRSISTNILEIPSGIVADLMGRRRSMIISFMGYIASFIFLYFLGGVFGFAAAAMLLFAVGEAFRTGTHKAMIMDYLERNALSHLSVAYYGNTRSFSQIGSALSSVLAALLVLYTGTYRVVFLASIVPYIINLAMMTTYPKYLDGARASSSSRFRTFLTFAKESFVDVARRPMLFRTMVSSSVCSANYKISRDYLQPIIKNWALLTPFMLVLEDTQRVAIVIGIVYGLIYFMTAIAARRSSAFQKKLKSTSRALNVTFLLNAAVLLIAGLMIAMGQFLIAVPVLILVFIVENLRRPMVIGYVNEIADKKKLATMLSVDSQFSTLLIAIFAPLVGYIADKAGVGMALFTFGLLILGAYPFSRVASVSHEGRDDEKS